MSHSAMPGMDARFSSQIQRNPSIERMSLGDDPWAFTGVKSSNSVDMVNTRPTAGNSKAKDTTFANQGTKTFPERGTRASAAKSSFPPESH